MLENNPYTRMQFNIYQHEGQEWQPEGWQRDIVVGSFDNHNKWEDYEFLFKDIDNLSEKVCIDFGCGPGRNLVKYAGRFKRIDGVDISPVLIEKAKIHLTHVGLNKDDFNLYVGSGYDLPTVPSNEYDIVMSTICLQHICVHDIRFSLFREFARILKSGGVFTAQMGFGKSPRYTASYYENHYNAQGTNSAEDVSIESEKYLEDDLYKLGFTDFKFYLRPAGPGDVHEKWIFFNARKI